MGQALPPTVQHVLTVNTGASFTFGSALETNVFLRAALANEFLPPGFSVTGNGSSRFGSTVILSQVEIQNLNGEPIPGLSLVSESGTLYPLSPANSVPEPTAALLLLSAVLCIAFGRRRLPRPDQKLLACLGAQGHRAVRLT